MIAEQSGINVNQIKFLLCHSNFTLGPICDWFLTLSRLFSTADDHGSDDIETSKQIS